MNVYSTSPPIVGLEITPSVSQIETGSDVTFTPSYDSAGEDLTFQLDYGKDSGKTNKNQSAPDMWTTKYFVPGQYQVMLYGNDVQNSILVSTIVLFFLFFGVFFADQYNDMVKYINILNMDSFIKKLFKLDLYIYEWYTTCKSLDKLYNLADSNGPYAYTLPV